MDKITEKLKGLVERLIDGLEERPIATTVKIIIATWLLVVVFKKVFGNDKAENV